MRYTITSEETGEIREFESFKEGGAYLGIASRTIFRILKESNDGF